MLVTLLLAGLFAAGNSPQEAKAPPQTERIKLRPFTVKLYDFPKPQVNPRCDVHTFMELVQLSPGIMATLEDRVEGKCPLRVDPISQSFYKLTEQKEDECHVWHYKGMSGQDRLEIIDTRAATCGKKAKARIIVIEWKQKEERRYYSAD